MTRLPDDQSECASASFREHMRAAASDPATAALVEEACRIIDRLDHIHQVETGKSAWIELLHFRTSPDDQQEIHVYIDKVISEARQQALALKVILTHLGVGKVDMNAAQETGDPIDEIAKRRAARRARTA